MDDIPPRDTPNARPLAGGELRETLLAARPVYEGRYLRVEERTVRLPDGREGRREIVAPPNAVGVLPITDQGVVYLVRQYRTALERTILEIPAGILEPGEDPEQTARRECGEEIGLSPARLEPLFGYYHSVGFSTGRIEVFLGRDLRPAPHAKPDGTEFLEVVTMPFDELLDRVRRGEIVDSKTLLAATWYHAFYA
ncbi:MAG: NUDIX hydrolase [Nitrospirota bacterium]